MKSEKKVSCPICGEIMEKYNYDYNTHPDEKINYYCSSCGHKETIILK